MQFSTIITTLSLALAATAAPAIIEARTGGHSGGHSGSQPESGSCTSSQYSHPVCCNGVTGSSGGVLLISVVRDIFGQFQCLLGGNVVGNLCGQESNNLCCNQDVSNTQNGVVNVAPIQVQCIAA